MLEFIQQGYHPPLSPLEQQHTENILKNIPYLKRYLTVRDRQQSVKVLGGWHQDPLSGIYHLSLQVAKHASNYHLYIQWIDEMCFIPFLTDEGGGVFYGNQMCV